ncbi:MAG: hydrogen gas-evolving membrane-bound hydrogenase subunit E [Atribacterota bacterium]
MTILIISSIRLGYVNQINMDSINYYLDNGVSDTGAINLVASIYLDYRAYDTLMETVVLFMAVMGVTFILRKDK